MIDQPTLFPNSERCDLILDLNHAALSADAVHEGLEALDAAGFVPHHLHTLSEHDVARIDASLVGAYGATVADGGAWLIEAKSSDAPVYVCGTPSITADADRSAPPNRAMAPSHISGGVAVFPPILGLAGYAGAAARLPRYAHERDLGFAGPFVLHGPLAPFRVTLTLAALFALRERGYGRAVLANIKRGAAQRLLGLFEDAVIVPQRGLARPRVVVCASGSGSNLQAVINAIEPATDVSQAGSLQPGPPQAGIRQLGIVQPEIGGKGASQTAASAAEVGTLPIALRRVIVNRADAFVFERAKAAGIDAVRLIWNRPTQSRAQFDALVAAAVAQAEPDLVLLLGWMHVLPASFLEQFPATLNIHPAYLPLNPAANDVTLPDLAQQAAFRGAHAVDDAIAAQATWIGASVHSVSSEVDRGAVLARVPLPLLEGETRAQLDARLHAAEHLILQAAIQRWIDGR